MHDPIFLVGFMGSGKSTIGRHLAEALGRRFIDTDVFVETRFRQRITDMFAEHGEAVFRRRERMAIEELMSMPDTVFATGGGLPCYTDTMEHLLQAGHVIYLRCSTPHSCRVSSGACACTARGAQRGWASSSAGR